MESLIELRQRNQTTNVITNGDYECEIPPLTLYKNDTIQLKQAFIDNIAKESGKILIPKDVDSITFKYCMYLQDQDTTVETAAASRNYIPAETNTPTGKNYILSSKDRGTVPGAGQTITNISADADCVITTQANHGFFVGDNVIFSNVSSASANSINGIQTVKSVLTTTTFTVGFSNSPQHLSVSHLSKVILDSVEMISFDKIIFKAIRNARDGASVLKGNFTYKDAAGNEHPWNFEIDKKVWRAMSIPYGPEQEFVWDEAGYTGNTSYGWKEAPPFGFQCQKKAYPLSGGGFSPLKFTAEGAKNAVKGKFEFVGVDGIIDITTNNCFTPWIFESTVKLPAGTALPPIELTRLLTRGLTDAQPNDDSIPAGQLVSPQMLDSFDNLKSRGVRYDGTLKNTPPYWVSEDCTSIIQFLDKGHNYLYGSSNFDFGYDFDTQLASIDSMHSSIYTGTLQCIVPMNVGPNHFVLNKTGGIFIMSCDQPDILTQGLNLPSSIFTKPGRQVTSTMGSLQTCTMTQFNLQDGINITGQSRFCDAYVTKSSGASDPTKAFDLAPGGSGSSTDYATNFGVASDQVTSILGTAQVGNDPDNLGGQNVTPYYQIELTSNFGFNKISNGIPSKKISAIVNKYYSTENFTTADSSMSTMYVHDSDEPLQISSIRVRILNPDGSLVDESTLQDDNTVFLSVIRQSTSDRIQEALQETKNKK